MEMYSRCNGCKTTENTQQITKSNESHWKLCWNSFRPRIGGAHIRPTLNSAPKFERNRRSFLFFPFFFFFVAVSSTISKMSKLPQLSKEQLQKILVEGPTVDASLPKCSPIGDFFRGKNVFLTGTTGFLGHLYLEKLLRWVCHRFSSPIFLPHTFTSLVRQSRCKICVCVDAIEEKSNAWRTFGAHVFWACVSKFT